MMFKKIIYTFVFCFCFAAGFGQPRGAKVETIGGKEFYVHTVKSGETLYEIAKMYKSPLADVLNSNPGKENKIDIGDKIKIPVTDKNRPKPDRDEVVNTGNNNVPQPQKLVTIDYKVEKGETVYGIARKFKTTDGEIYTLNPSAVNGISVGQILKIQTTLPGNHPISGNPVPVKPAEPRVLFDHTVQPQETFFSLSRKYNISQDSIKLLNDGLPEGLKAGSVIKLAAPESKLELYKSWETNTANGTSNNNNNTTTNASSGNNEAKSSVYKTGKKSVYNVALMLPLMLDKNQKHMESPNSEGKYTVYEPTRQALDFQLGVMLAIDSLKKAGLNTNLKVFEVNKDSSLCRKATNTDEFKQADLIIGPFYNIELVAKAARENKTPMMVPVPCSNRVLLDNPFVFKAITTSAVIADETSRYIVNNYKDENLILIDGKGKNDVGVVKAYAKYLNKYYFEKTGKTDSIKPRSMEFSEKSLLATLKKDKLNILIIPSNEFAYVSATLNSLNKFLARSYHKEYRVMVFGTDEWIKWDQMDITHKLRTNVHVPTPTLVDFDTLQTHKLIRSFRARYKTDPDKYALLGFDLAYFWLSGYAQYGLDFAAIVPDFDISLTQTRFIFTKMNETSGCLNKNVYILRYQDYQLIPQKNE